MMDVAIENVSQFIKRFQISGVCFTAEFIQPAPVSGHVKNENLWRLASFTYHKNTLLRKIRRPRHKQIPRMKTCGFFESIEECVNEARRIVKADANQETR